MSASPIYVWCECAQEEKVEPQRRHRREEKQHSKWRRNVPLNGIVSLSRVRSDHVCLTDCGSLMCESITIH